MNSFTQCLLLRLSWEEGEAWMSLYEAMASSATLYKQRYSTASPLAYPTMRLYKVKAIREGWLEQRRNKQHFQLRITEEGRRMIEQALAEEGKREANGNGEDVPIPIRLGKGHMLDLIVWRAVMQRVKDGELDVLIIPRDMKTKVGYVSSMSGGVS